MTDPSPVQASHPELEDELDPKSQRLLITVLQQAINDLLNPDYSAIDEDMLACLSASELSCSCDPELCPVELMKDDVEPFFGMLRRCERIQVLRNLPEFSAKAWFHDPYDGPWSYRWICRSLGVDADMLLTHILFMPRTRRGVTLNGRKLYKSNSASYPGSASRDEMQEALAGG